MTIPKTIRVGAIMWAFASCLPSTSAAQGRESAGLGFEAQLYPSGAIFAARGAIRLGDSDMLLGYAGYNLAERRAGFVPRAR